MTHLLVYKYSGGTASLLSHVGQVTLTQTLNACASHRTSLYDPTDSLDPTSLEGTTILIRTTNGTTLYRGEIEGIELGVEGTTQKTFVLEGRDDLRKSFWTELSTNTALVISSGDPATIVRRIAYELGLSYDGTTIPLTGLSRTLDVRSEIAWDALEACRTICGSAYKAYYYVLPSGTTSWLYFHDPPTGTSGTWTGDNMRVEHVERNRSELRDKIVYTYNHGYDTVTKGAGNRVCKVNDPNLTSDSLAEQRAQLILDTLNQSRWTGSFTTTGGMDTSIKIGEMYHVSETLADLDDDVFVVEVEHTQPERRAAGATRVAFNERPRNLPDIFQPTGNTPSSVLEIDTSPDTTSWIVVGTEGTSDEDYTCDGTADDVEIQEAFDTGAAHILIKKGTYNLEDMVTINTTQHVWGEGKWATILKAQTGVPTTAHIYSQNGCNGLNTMTIDMNQKGGTALLFGSTGSPDIIEDCEIYSIYQSTAPPYAIETNGGDLTIRGCEIYLRAAFSTTKHSSAIHVLHDRAHIEDTKIMEERGYEGMDTMGVTSILIDANVRGVVITGCYIVGRVEVGGGKSVLVGKRLAEKGGISFAFGKRYAYRALRSTTTATGTLSFTNQIIDDSGLGVDLDIYMSGAVTTGTIWVTGTLVGGVGTTIGTPISGAGWYDVAHKFISLQQTDGIWCEGNPGGNIVIMEDLFDEVVYLTSSSDDCVVVGNSGLGGVKDSGTGNVVASNT